MFTKRAARAGHAFCAPRRPPTRAATRPGAAWPVAVRVRRGQPTLPGRGGRCLAGAISVAARSTGAGVGARSALRELTCRRLSECSERSERSEFGDTTPVTSIAAQSARSADRHRMSDCQVPPAATRLARRESGLPRRQHRAESHRSLACRSESPNADGYQVLSRGSMRKGISTVSGGSGRPSWCGLDGAQHQLAGGAADRLAVDADRGDARMAVAADLEVAEAGDRDAPGHGPAAPLALGQRAEGRQVGHAHRGVHVGPLLHQLHHRLRALRHRDRRLAEARSRGLRAGRARGSPRCSRAGGRRRACRGSSVPPMKAMRR